MLRRVLRETGTGRGGLAVDIGSGTGHLAVQLASEGLHIIAIEPLSSMRAHIPIGPKLHAIGGAAEQLPLQDHVADLLAAGQAWHWFQARLAAEEAHRVLRPGGTVLMLWNIFDNTVPWLDRIEQISRARDPRRARGFDPGDMSHLFPAARWTPIRRARAVHHHVIERDGLAELVLTSSVFAGLAEHDRSMVREKISAIVSEQAAKGDTVSVPYQTWAYWTRRR
ncbi:class I SAM-dependent methyltransferase [Nonomuraea sp. NPDC049695]|uniref:class I SAM-dependent methyltransferase n=1 Tax=Nonomuraea sp. NPDC049695 TaxID=3154734 RepID=UPI003439BC2D